jgi:hypothetical protein
MTLKIDSPLLSPKEVTVKGLDEVERKFTISKLPALVGREIIAKYPLSALPKIGDYAVNEETMFKMMQYVAVSNDQGGFMRLMSPEMINGHVGDWETLIQIEREMLEYNTSFFKGGFVQNFTAMLLEQAAPLLSRILTSSLQALSQANLQVGSNSETK